MFYSRFFWLCFGGMRGRLIAEGKSIMQDKKKGLEEYESEESYRRAPYYQIL